jgi:hypothetical protein
MTQWGPVAIMSRSLSLCSPRIMCHENAVRRDLLSTELHVLGMCETMDPRVLCG